MNNKLHEYKYKNTILKDRNIIITGATDGIGRALALESAKNGAKVIGIFLFEIISTVLSKCIILPGIE